MTDRLSPTPEAKARIQAHSEAEFLTLFNELPVDAFQRVARHLPKVDGFRPTSTAGIAKQKAALARKLSKTNATDREYYGLYLIWREWIYATFKNSATVQELIDQIEDAANSVQDEAKRSLAIDSKVDALFAKLSDDSRQNLCTRENIERLLAFSPWSVTNAARDMIAASKASSEVERDKKVSELPERLQRDEAAIRDIAAQLKAAIDRTDQNMRSVTQVTSQIAELRAATAQIKRDIDGLRTDGQQHAAEQRNLRQEAIAAGKASESRFKSLSDVIGELLAVIDSLRAQSSHISGLDESIATLGNFVSESSKAKLEIDASIARLQANVDQLTRDVIAISDTRAANESVISRLMDLEARVASGSLAASSSEPIAATPVVGLTERRPLAWESIVSRRPATAVAVENLDQIATGFSKTLRSTGLRKQAAEVFAEECAAALIARQAIFLKGAFATHVGRALAASFASSSALRMSIPLGMENDTRIRDAILEGLNATATDIGAIVIEGVDIVPMQMLRDVIADSLMPNRGMRAKPRLAVFGTIADGIASVPVEKTYFELGPLFDLDVLDWRMAHTSDTSIVAHAVTATVDDTFWDMLAKESADIDEASRLIRLFSSRRDPAVEQAILRAFRALLLVRKRATDYVTPLQSLFYGWLLPYWRTRKIARSQVDEEVDGGKVNGEVDRRLQLLLAEFPEETVS